VLRDGDTTRLGRRSLVIGTSFNTLAVQRAVAIQAMRVATIAGSRETRSSAG
jgi:hypothetical protein